MTINYYLAWIHFDAYGRQMTRLPEGHRILEVLDKSGSNRHTPALWVLVEAVVATPSYTPPAGFPAAAEVPPEYRQHNTSEPNPSFNPYGPQPVPPRDQRNYSGEDSGLATEGHTSYPELYPRERDDDYRADTGGFSPSIPMSPATGTPTGRR